MTSISNAVVWFGPYFFFFSFVAWIAVQFFSLVLWWQKLMAKLGMYDNDENNNIESVDTTVRQMDDWPYAATRNANQQRKNGGTP